MVLSSLWEMFSAVKRRDMGKRLVRRVGHGVNRGLLFHLHRAAWARLGYLQKMVEIEDQT